MNKLCDTNLRKLEDIWVVFISVLAAMLLASHQLSQNSEFGLVANYIYWICRVLAEAGIFIAVLVAIERYLGKLLLEWGTFAVAILVSLVPFALTITAFDLIVGLPELGLNDDSAALLSTSRLFGYELIYLLDNHVVLCLMLLLPRLIQTYSLSEPSEQSRPLVEPDASTSLNFFIKSFKPPLRGELCSVEAQEHYVQVVSSEESRMVLYRFSDVVRQMPESIGMQVHRSHWVAHSAVKETVMQGQTMKLALKDGRFVPVSRTFRHAVESRFDQALN